MGSKEVGNCVFSACSNPRRMFAGIHQRANARHVPHEGGCGGDACCSAQAARQGWTRARHEGSRCRLWLLRNQTAHSGSQNTLILLVSLNLLPPSCLSFSSLFDYPFHEVVDPPFPPKTLQLWNKKEKIIYQFTENFFIYILWHFFILFNFN